MQADIKEPLRAAEEGMKESSDTLPLSFVLEGKSVGLTTVLQSTMAIWMISMAFEGGGMLHRFGLPADSFAANLLQYLVYIIVGTLAAALGVCTLPVDRQITNDDNWRLQSAQSKCALVAIDALAVYDTQAIVRSLIAAASSETSNAEWISLMATVFLWLSGMCFIFVFNYLFVCESGCCIWLSNQRAGFLRFLNKNMTWKSIMNRAPGQREPSIANREPECSNESLLDGQDSTEQDSTDLPTHVHATSSIPEEHCTTRNETRIAFQNALYSSVTRGRCSEITLVRFCEIEEHPLAPINTQCSSQDMDQNVGEDPSFQDQSIRATFEESHSLKGDVSMTMDKRLLIGDEKIMSLFRLSRHSMKNLWDAVKEENGRFRYPVWVKSTFLTSVVMLIYACIKTIGLVVSMVEQYEEQRDRIEDNMEKLNDFLVETGWKDGVDGIARTTVVRLLLIVDKVIRSLKWTTFVGYPAGTMFGTCNVIAILVQYKRVSLKVSAETKQNIDQREIGEQGNSQWMEFQEQYPVINAYIFMAIVSSTAILQTQIAAVIICLMLGLLRYCVDLWSMLVYFGPFLSASASIFVLDFLAMKFLKQHLMHKNGRSIKHPRRFNLFILVLSTVHLLIGLLYAFWRVVYLMITTLFVLNRLDVSLFTSLKSLDNGHNAYMSMLTLNVLIQRDTECRTGRPEVEMEMFLERNLSGRIYPL